MQDLKFLLFPPLQRLPRLGNPVKAKHFLGGLIYPELDLSWSLGTPFLISTAEPELNFYL